MRVLLVEDHADLADTVATGLRREGMAVDVALDGRDAFAHIAVTDYDVLVLDRDLPDVRGDEICRSLAAESRPRADHHAHGGGVDRGPRGWPEHRR